MLYKGGLFRDDINGIDYALMQLNAESYDLMKGLLDMHPDELHRIYSR